MMEFHFGHTRKNVQFPVQNRNYHFMGISPTNSHTVQHFFCCCFLIKTNNISHFKKGSIIVFSCKNSSTKIQNCILLKYFWKKIRYRLLSDKCLRWNWQQLLKFAWLALPSQARQQSGGSAPQTLALAVQAALGRLSAAGAARARAFFPRSSFANGDLTRKTRLRRIYVVYFWYCCLSTICYYRVSHSKLWKLILL